MPRIGGLTEKEHAYLLKLTSKGKGNAKMTKRDFVEEDLDAALEKGKRLEQPRKLDANQEILLVSILCSKLVKGRSQWTLTNQLIFLTKMGPL